MDQLSPAKDQPWTSFDQIISARSERQAQWRSGRVKCVGLCAQRVLCLFQALLLTHWVTLHNRLTLSKLSFLVYKVGTILVLAQEDLIR